MIRINLLSEGKKPVAASPVGRPGGGAREPGLWALAGLVLLGLLIVGGRYLYLRHSLTETQEKVTEAQREVDALASVLREVEDYKIKKAELERKVEVITDLKLNQQGPVRIMDQVSRALPELLWLNRMEVKKNRITISGEAFNTNAVAAFIENLDKMQGFGEPILRDTSQRANVYTFVLAFDFTYSAPAGAEDESEPATGG